MKCLQCRSETSNNKFCSRSCAATYNNLKGQANRRKPEGKCRECKKPIITRKTWCDSCLLSFSNSPPRKSRTFSTGLEGPCLDPLIESKCACGTIIQNKSILCKSCSAKASGKIKSNAKLKLWLTGEWSGGTNYGLSEIVRKYLLEQSSYCCSKCGFNTNHPDDNKTILEINHIDGNGINHSPGNLEVLCPNCHALTSSYRGRNLGNGRPTYYLRRTV
jgi:hypothetical protein